ncbi:hypothetical protein KTT_55000 [Tengunoibacter tsumagoiensis]|uniref:TIR domain-containing protein n=2 Tax=Tengunoibacter tsumagoiensis TaxID=2014871 RepID=A0A402A9L0_9CHLR|nr:hypothetical protein KTT_55000 [Tengunoibacter tsumagoiensis]
MDITTEGATPSSPQNDLEKTSESKIQKPIKIFFCYAHEDELLLQKLQKQLGALRKLGLLDFWHDRDISAGTNWQQEINQQLDEAQIILLLVSPDFVNSDYCYSTEMEQALERHRQGTNYVIPIILRPVHWQGTPFSHLQVLPTDAKPLSGWSNLDEAFFDVAEGIKKVVEAFLKEEKTQDGKQIRTNKPDVQIVHPHKIKIPASFFMPRFGLRNIFFILFCLFLVIGNNIAWFFVTQQDQLRASLRSTAAANTYWAVTARRGVDFGFNAAHTRLNPYEQIINTMNAIHLAPLWSYHTGNSIYSESAVINSTIYIGSRDGKLYAFDASCSSACQPLWSYQTGGPIFSSPAVAGGMVYIGSRDGKLYAFDASCSSACQPLWSYQTNDWVDSSPTVANDMVYIGSNDNRLYAFDASCSSACQPLWSYQTNGWIDSSPAVAGGIVYISSFDGNVYAFDATCRKTCRPLWSYSRGRALVASPAVADGMVYIGSETGEFYAFSAACRNSCQPLWIYTGNKPFGSSPAVANGIVYVGSDNGKFYAFDAACHNPCSPLWSYQTDGSVYSSPAVANNVVYVGSRDGKLYAFDAACRNSCQPLWSEQIASSIDSAPTVANGMVYIGTYNGDLYTLGLTA